MKPLGKELKSVIAQHLEQASTADVLVIASALCGEKQPQIQVTPRNLEPQFEIVDDDVVFDHSTGLYWLRDFVPGGRRPWTESVEAASKIDVRGWKWAAPTLRQRHTISDYSRFNPAIDINFFRSEKDGWEWTATKDCEESSDCAWSVDFDDGYSIRGDRGSHGWVRAVRVGQF